MLGLASISKFSCLCSQLIIYRWSRQNYSKDCFLIMYLGEVNEGFCGFKFLSCKSTGQRMPCIFSIREEFYLSNFITYCDFSTRTKWKNDKQKYSSLKFYYMLAKFCLSGYRLPEQNSAQRAFVCGDTLRVHPLFPGRTHSEKKTGSLWKPKATWHCSLALVQLEAGLLLTARLLCFPMEHKEFQRMP